MASTKVWIKIHRSKTGEVVVAICDENLLGKKLKVNDTFSVEVSRAFYGGFLVRCDDIDKYLEQAGIVNVLGESITSYLIRKGLVSEGAVMRIGEVPHVQLFLKI
ncbi:MAG: DUF424 family protein [Nitrososphaeria archaeon]|nr:DUF424 family protein [Nitrososphaeria archaeon]